MLNDFIQVDVSLCQNFERCEVKDVKKSIFIHAIIAFKILYSSKYLIMNGI